MFRFSSTSKLEKLQLRLTVSVALALLVTVIIILVMHNASNIIAEHQLQEDAEKMLQVEARKKMKAEVQFLLSDITNQFDEAFRVALGIADILKTFHESNMPRENALAVLKAPLKATLSFLASMPRLNRMPTMAKIKNIVTKKRLAATRVDDLCLILIELVVQCVLKCFPVSMTTALMRQALPETPGILVLKIPCNLVP